MTNLQYMHFSISDVISQPLVPTASAMPGIDYYIVEETLTFENGQTTASFTLEVMDDNIVEDEEIFELRLRRHDSAIPADNCVLATRNFADVKIEDDDCKLF